MANPLTGDYGAVIQVSIRQINGLLATLHTNSDVKGAPLSFPHSLTLRVGGAPPGVKSGTKEFGIWLWGIRPQISQAAIAVNGPPVVRAEFPSLPPGAAVAIQSEFSRWYETATTPTLSGRVSGQAQVQCSSPVVSVEEGAIGELTASVFIRVLYFPEAGSRQFGEPVHGEVRVSYRPQSRTLPSGEAVFEVPFPADDSKIRFLPEPGTLTAAETADLEKQLRIILRTGFKPMMVHLNGEFPFAQFKGVGSLPGSGQALAIAIPGPFPGNAEIDIDSIQNAFLGASDFGVAISKEAIGGLLQKFIEKINADIAALRVEALGATYKARFSSGPTLTLQTGRILFSGRVEIETAAVLAPDGFISFEQALTLEFDPTTQLLSLQAQGDPSVDESWFIPHGTALGIIRSQRDAALAPASGPIRTALAGARDSLTRALLHFDRTASAKYKAVAITPDGVIVTGDIGTRHHYTPVTTFAETPDRTGFTAFESWIPGGRITNFHWSWVEQAVFTTEAGWNFTIAWFAKVRSADHPHRFVLPKPNKVEVPSQICLRVDGTQITSNGDPTPVSEGRSCHVGAREPMLTLPAGWEKVMVPSYLPDPAPDSIVRDAIRGHLDVVSRTRNRGRSGTNTLVYFCDWRASERPLNGLLRGLASFRGQSTPIAVTVVLPRGGLGMTRRDFESRLGPLEPVDLREGQAPGTLDFTEDTLGGWAEVFGSSAMPALYLINAHGDYVWKHEGEIEPERLAAALERHAVPSEGPGTSLLSLSIQPGQRVPNAYFVDDRQDGISLGRFGGTRLMLCFWQSWSDPCRLELRRMQELLNRAEPGSLAVVGLCPDADSEQIREFRERNRLTLVLGQDVDRQIASLFGIRFWPTTVSISPSQVVDGVQFGLAPRDRDRVQEPSL